MKMVYNEWYGTISHAQQAAYRKHNISPMDHNMLVEHFGEHAHAAITKFVNDGGQVFRLGRGW